VKREMLKLSGLRFPDLASMTLSYLLWLRSCSIQWDISWLVYQLLNVEECALLLNNTTNFENPTTGDRMQRVIVNHQLENW